MLKTRKKNKAGFTLVEMLLYISLTSIIMIATSSFLVILLQSRVENQVKAEVEQQAQQIIDTIGLAIRNAEGINSPVPAASAGTLSLDVYNAGTDPTIFDSASNIVRITEGAGSAIDLSTSRVNVTNLTFENITKVDTPGTIRLTFTVTYTSTSKRQEYDYSKDYYATFNLRQP